VLFPLYWLVITSVKLPIHVDRGPFYLPFIDFQPSLHAWNALFELGNDTLRPYVNTVVVGLTSAVIALAMGSAAAYALVRFTYRPRIGLIALGALCVAGAYGAELGGVAWQLAVVSGAAVFALLAQAIARSYMRTIA
jgi:multiple sugar transport system permease protein